MAIALERTQGHQTPLERKMRFVALSGTNKPTVNVSLPAKWLISFWKRASMWCPKTQKGSPEDSFQCCTPEGTAIPGKA